MSMRALKLNFRTTLCFGVVCFLLLIQGAMTLIKVDKVYSSTVEIQNNWLPSIRLAGQIDSTFYKLRLDLRRYAMEYADKDPASLEKLKAVRAEVLQVAEHYGTLVTSPEERTKYDQALSEIKNYSQKMDEFLAQASSFSAEQMAVYLRDVNGPIARQVQASISDLIAINEQGSKTAVQAAASEHDAARLFTWVLMVSSVLIAVVVARLLTRSIINPVRELLVSTGKIADGDLRVAITISGNDELTELQKSTATMQMNLKSTLQHISEASGQLASAAEEMSAITRESTAGIERQSLETDQAATAVNQMTAAVEEVARNAVSASQSTQDSQRSASVGMERVTQTIASIEKLSSTVQQTGVEVEGLAKQAQDIARVVEVIRSIAEQTNLLALNAAIEAARAGEQGRGFAVVADEVRALAHRTQTSTQEIEQMIAKIQSCSSEAVASMVLNRNEAVDSLKVAHEAGVAITQITQAITDINERNLMIATASEEQAQVARSVDQNLISIRDLSIQSSSAAGQTSVASQELSRLAVDLKQIVAKFAVS
ncbi:methyl-accepting chemotaxis protein [Pseudomonas allii]|uniref:Methyl-accepting chemotaxis protein n=2 Tax=Pseudomonas allii TaxID=2740531 RepID=A0ACC6LK56_9PSED|nr:methyl-accepting chemotaxis protein [Pseudomonas allii]KTB58575.1 chemotaxis protein [Pseudomonas fluorescens]MDR9878893.1 methyl-accepting chemotaxis protein [Pseudomonas allii]NWN51585.1 methyl-accepting chemotaxis protein [Pseudomonas allii]NWN65246.1 methyl-accepting chemotaxis protein [Pseudomonas allii]